MLQLFQMPTGIIDTTTGFWPFLPKDFDEDCNYGIISILRESFSYIAPNLTPNQISSILNSPFTSVMSTVDFLETERYVSLSSISSTKCYVIPELRYYLMDELAQYLRYDTVTKHVQF